MILSPPTASGRRPRQSLAVRPDFTWPAVGAGSPDNAVASGRSIEVEGTGRTLGLLATGTYGAVSGAGTLAYADGSRQPATIYFVGPPLRDKPVSRVDVPHVSGEPAVGVPTMHIFAMAVGG